MIAKEVFSNEAVKDAYEQNRDFIEVLQENSGVPLPNIREVDKVVEALKIRVSLFQMLNFQILHDFSK